MIYMLCYLVYDSDYRLYEVFENKPKWDENLRWHAEGWHEVVCAKDVPGVTTRVLSEIGMLEVCISVSVLYHTERDCAKIGEDDKPCN